MRTAGSRYPEKRARDHQAGHGVADHRAGLQARQAPGEKQRQQSGHEARAQEIKLDGAIKPHRRPSPFHLLGREMGDGDKHQRQKSKDSQINQERPWPIIVIDHAQQDDTYGNDDSPDMHPPKCIPGSQISKNPKQG